MVVESAGAALVATGALSFYLELQQRETDRAVRNATLIAQVSSLAKPGDRAAGIGIASLVEFLVREGVSLDAASFTGVYFPARTDFSGAQLRSANFDNVVLTAGIFHEANLGDTIPTPESIEIGIWGTGASFREASLHAADFSYGKVQVADFEAARMGRADFTNAQLGMSNFHKAELTSAIFERASGFALDAGDATLQKVNFKYANLSYAHFDNSDLSLADFQNAQLDSASFVNSVLYKANFINADVTNADFRKSDITQSQLNQSCQRSTGPPPQIPEHLDWPAKACGT